MQSVSPSSSITPGSKRNMLSKLKAAWTRGNQSVHGSLVNGYFFPVHTESAALNGNAKCM